jgi:hypothetical protein
MAETLPWASGKRKPPPGGKKKPRRRFRLKSRRQGVIAAVWAVITLLLLISALLTQAMLYVVLVIVSSLVTALASFAAIGEPDPVPARTAPTPRSANPRGTADSGGSRRQPGTAAVICTQTGVPTDKCTASHKHAMTAAGVARYRKKYGTKKIGDPYGGGVTRKPAKPKAKTTKEPRVPTTSNAKPYRPGVGEVMRRVS